MKKTALLIVTLDTKSEEALFLKKVLKRQGLNVLIMDVGIFPSPAAGDITREDVATAAGEEIKRLIQTKDKGMAIKTMMRGATALTESLYRQGRIHGALSIGGAQGTLIGTSAMKGLPVGVPKLMLSTVASGKRVFEDYVGTNDMTLMHSVVDFFGLNGILKQVLSNAAGALAGMVKLEKVRPEKKKKVAITIYGTTTPAGRLIVSLLEKAGYEVIA
ncbi:MAG: Tm-1-like ATP-binding domain-containing protein, partial [Thermodesulfobacteriota bacterium]